MYRVIAGGKIEIFLGHPGGPWYWNRLDACWQAPRGEVEESDKDLLQAARREFEEETGIKTPARRYVYLGWVQQADGKKIYYWAFKKNWKGKSIESNTFSMEYPMGTGEFVRFPELNAGKYFSVEEASVKISRTLVPLIGTLVSLVTSSIQQKKEKDKQWTAMRIRRKK
jgi:predicted NUDIX family NTP pyrophosphohydrolase